MGAFHQPHCVVVDPELLHTLPEAHLRAGLAEAVKHGAIADAAYLEWIEENADALLAGDLGALSRLIVRSVEIKSEIVARDERECGPRTLLNFGHTIAHALEAVSGYSMLHGEAVAVGMVEEARIGERSGLTAPGTAARLRAVLTRLGLPTSLPVGVDADGIVRYTRADKKARDGRVEYALIQEIGVPVAAREGRWGNAVADETVAAVLIGAARG